MRKVLIAAGGTAGHVNPALAIADGIRSRWPDVEVHFAGREKGMENRLVTQAGYPFHPFEVRGIQRSFAPGDIVRNAQAAWYLALSPAKASSLLKKLQPAMVIGTGGYVSGPLLHTAAKQGYKTAIHEQNAFPGVTNKLLAKEVDMVFAPTESAVERLGYPEKSTVTGNPVRPEMFLQDREASRQEIGAGDRTVLLSYGGSNGAMRVNEMIAELAEWHLKHKNFLHIHATGGIEKESFARLAKQKGIADDARFIIKEYINNMPAMLAAADLVICRAGALTLAELAAVGRASILIPSPNVAENHQYYNALEFAEAGAARVYEEKTLTPKLLTDTVDELTTEPGLLQDMGARARELAHPGALDMILDKLATAL